MSIYKPQSPYKTKEDDLRELLEYSRRRVIALQQEVQEARKEKDAYFIALRTLIINELRGERKNEFLTHPNKAIRELAENLSFIIRDEDGKVK